jgi:hypothetical protein
MVKLVTNMQDGTLKEPFLVMPPKGALAEIPMPKISNLAEPPWLKEFMEREAAQSHVGGRDFQYYVSTKRLDRNRGVCAYMAVSVTDEGEKPKWLQMGSSKPFELDNFEEQIESIYKQIMHRDATEEDLLNYEDLILQAIDAELSGQVKAGVSYNLEKILEQFETFMMMRDENVVEKGRRFLLQILRQTIQGILQQHEEEKADLESLLSEIY